MHRFDLLPFAAGLALALAAVECVAIEPMPPAAASGRPAARTEEVTVQSNGYALAGCVTRPGHEGPLPVVIYNHGSEKDPRRCGPPELVRAYVEHGYLFFAFQRHGHGQSPGAYIGDLQRKIRTEERNSVTQAQRVAALQDDYNRDVVGAVAWLMQRPEVDRKRVVMTGISYGGIQTLLTAEKGPGLRAYVAFAPGAMSWGNQALRQRLVQAVRNAKAPLFLAQAQNDYSLGPSEVLGPILRAKGAPNETRVYPAFGNTPQQGHADFAVRGGIPIWQSDVLAFFERVLKATAMPGPNGPP